MRHRWRPTVCAAPWRRRPRLSAPCLGWNPSASPPALLKDSDRTRGVTLVVNPLVVRLPLEGVVDLAAEQDRLREELANCQQELERKEKLVNNPNFRAKARADVVETEEDRLRNLQEQQQRLGEILAQIGG